MAGLQRSAVSFRRQGSSGLIWDDKFLKELNQESDNNKQQQKEQEQAAAAVEISSSQQDQQEQQQLQVDAKPPKSVNTTIERSRSAGGSSGARGYRTGRVSPAIEPPSPRVSACGFCSAFANKPRKNNTNAKRTGKRRSRQF